MNTSQHDSFPEPPERPDWLPPRNTQRASEITEFITKSPPAIDIIDFTPVAAGAKRDARTSMEEKSVLTTSGSSEKNGEDVESEGFDSALERKPFPHPLRHPFAACFWVIRTLFGILSLILLLAVIAAIPLVNFLALGYLLEAQGRVARTGRFRDAFPLLDIAPRLGTIAIGIWLWLMPLRLLSGAASDARLIDPHGNATIWLGRIVVIAATIVSVHILLALARGGRFWCFFRPIKNVRSLIGRVRKGGFLRDAEQHIREFVVRMRLGYHFWLGIRGFFGALIWLFLPTALLSAANKTEGGLILVTLVGGLCLIAVLSWLPFLQARFAAENRFRAYFELGTIRQFIARAPLTWLLAVIAVFLLALPLYLFKVVAPPRDAMWFITLVFIASIYPAKIIAGWAYHRAATKQKPTGWFFRWTTRLVIIPLLAAYVFLLFLTPAISQHGKAVLFEHHAFLLPVPF